MEFLTPGWDLNLGENITVEFDVSDCEEGEEGGVGGNGVENGRATVAHDLDITSRDVGAGLIQMGILPRIRYILEVKKSNFWTTFVLLAIFPRRPAL